MANFIMNLSLDGKNVLDMGCGSGILSLAAASRGASVIAIDVNLKAVEACRLNADRNMLSNRIEVNVGDLFGALRGDPFFDFIIVNPPFYSGKPQDIADMAWKGGDDLDFFRRLSDTLGKFLAPCGKMVYVISSDARTNEIEAMFLRKGFDVKTIRKKNYIFESLFINEVMRIS